MVTVNKHPPLCYLHYGCYLLAIAKLVKLDVVIRVKLNYNITYTQTLGRDELMEKM